MKLVGLVAGLLLVSPATMAEPTKHRAPPADSPRAHHAPSASSPRSSSSKTKKRSGRSRRRGRGGASVAGSIAGAIFAPVAAAMGAVMVEAIRKSRSPRLRHTGFLDLGVGYDSVWTPGALLHKDTALFRFKVGYRTRPLGEGDGMALELAFGALLRGRSGGADHPEQGMTLTLVGGELRLYGRARQAAQPYLQAGCGYSSMNAGEKHSGVGLQAGGGLQLWPFHHLALDLNVVYDAAFYAGVERPSQGLGANLGIKVYF